MKTAFATVTGEQVPGTNRERKRKLRLYLDESRAADGSRDWNKPDATFGAGKGEADRLVEWLRANCIDTVLHSSSVDDTENWQFGRVYRDATQRWFAA